MATRETLHVALEASGMLVERPTGIGMYGRCLVEAMAHHDGADFVLIHPLGRWRRRKTMRRTGICVPIRPYLSGRRLARRYSLVHALDTRIPAAYAGPLVVNVYDTLAALPLTRKLGLAPREFQEKKERAYRTIADRADAIITLSSAVRDEFLSRFPTRALVVVIPPGVDPPSPLLSRRRTLELLAARGISPPFLLAVGALCPRKNIEAAVRAFRAIRRRLPGIKLVLAGEAAYGWEGSRGKEAVRQAGEYVVTPGYLNRDELWAAYTAASAVLHLAHYEGYGLPVLEALSVGTPVVASRRGGIPEATANAAFLVDPDDDLEVEAAILRALGGGADVEACRRLGILHGTRLTWGRAAERIEELYRQVLGS